MLLLIIHRIVAVLLGLATGIGECFLLINIVDIIVNGRGTPIAKMLLFVFMPIPVLFAVVVFLDAFALIWAGSAAALSLAICAFVKYRKLRR